MGSNQSMKPKAEVEESESLEIDDRDKAFVKELENYFYIETVKHVEKTTLTMGSNQSTSKPEAKGREILLIDEDENVFVKRICIRLIIGTVEHAMKTKISRQDEEGIQNAIADGDKKKLRWILKNIIERRRH